MTLFVVILMMIKLHLLILFFFLWLRRNSEFRLWGSFVNYVIENIFSTTLPLPSSQKYSVGKNFLYLDKNSSTPLLALKRDVIYERPLISDVDRIC